MKITMRTKNLLIIGATSAIILLGGLFVIRHQGFYWCKYCCLTATGKQWLIGSFPITSMKYSVDSQQEYLVPQPEHTHEWIITQGNDFNMGGLVTISSIRGPFPCSEKETPNQKNAPDQNSVR